MTRARDLAAFVSNADGDIKFDTDTLFIDSSANRVGIGNTAPATDLEITGTSVASASLTTDTYTSGTELKVQGDGSSFLYNKENQMLRFGTNNLERIRIANDGNVGIGDTAPDSKLSVIASGANGIELAPDSSLATDSSRLFFVTSGGSNAIFSSSGALRFHTGSTVASSSGTERMRMDSSGNLLHSKTTSDGSIQGHEFRVNNFAIHTVDNGAALGARRIGSGTNDFGKIMFFENADGSVGDIGNRAGYLGIGSGDVGIEFHAGDNTVYPAQAGGGNYALTNGSINLGGGSYRWATIYAATGTINTSDENQKQQIANLTDAEITAAIAISKLFKTYKWNDAVEVKGESARIHTGVIAQQVEQAMTDAGLDASKYGFFCRDTVYETFTEVPAVEADEENGIEGQAAYTRVEHYHTLEDAPEGAVERTTKGVRYEELLSFIGAATEQRLTSIEARLDALEA